MVRDYLIEVGAGFRLARAIEVIYIDELKVVAEAGVSCAILRQSRNVAQVAQSAIPPTIQVAYADK